jgi:hypothetical protein
VRSRLASFWIVSLMLGFAAQQAPASAQGLFDWFGGNQQRQQQQRQQQQQPRQQQRDNSWFGGGERRDSWFGGGDRRQDSWWGQRPQQQQPNAYSDPNGYYDDQRYGPTTTPSIGGNTGRSVAYCVRLCDGRYFPMQRHANANPVQLCNAFCPAAKTQVFNGSQIDYAVANNGSRYSDLENAFVYRQKILPGCTCNGRDTFGLAPISIANDPTLRQGDIVSNGDNQKAALAAAANKQARAAATEKPTRDGKAAAKAGAKPEPAADANPDTEERPED